MGDLLIDPKDNVKIRPEDGQKYALRDIAAGESVVKYGYPIGTATADIPAGAHVHAHNLKTNLTGQTEIPYTPEHAVLPPLPPALIDAYVRPDGNIGIRNDVWVIPTVGCVNGAARAVAQKTGAVALCHPYGCSQLGDDHARTQQILAGLARHPNAGGVLILGLGCENNRIGEFRRVLGSVDETRVRFLNAQDCTDEIEDGVRIVKELQTLASKDQRQRVPVSKLKVGLKCGGSDGYSGVTANPLVGQITDRLAAMGGAAVLTEVPEMFGAEQALLGRCVSKELFRKALAMVNGYKAYFTAHGQPVSENPSPGNRDGGITTLEEKSLGCVRKGGHAPITAVLGYGDTVKGNGLQLLDGPGNDAVAVTNLTAAGCQLILFTTGRGTPLGAPVPTVKIASNTALAQKKPGWIDYDAMAGDADGLFDLLLRTACGAPTKNEASGNREIAIFKDGVTL